MPPSDDYSWSDWNWTPQYGCHERHRRQRSNGEWIYEYQAPETSPAAHIPRSMIPADPPDALADITSGVENLTHNASPYASNDIGEAGTSNPYPSTGISQGEYSQTGYSQAGYPQVGYPQAGYLQAGYPQAGYPQAGYPQAGYPQAGYPQAGHPQARHSQARHSQVGHSQAGHSQAGHSQARLPQGASTYIRTRDPGVNVALDPNFKTCKSREFTFGRIFKVLWSEPTGSRGTEITAPYGQRAHHKIRRFVIISSMRGHSICLPIHTYGGQGTKKHGAHPEDHAVIYSSKGGGYCLPEENGIVKASIRCSIIKTKEKLDPASRLNYAKLYTVEHNVKVNFVGKVARKYEQQIVADYNSTHPSLQPRSYSVGDHPVDEGSDTDEDAEEGIVEEGEDAEEDDAEEEDVEEEDAEEENAGYLLNASSEGFASGPGNTDKPSGHNRPPTHGAASSHGGPSSHGGKSVTRHDAQSSSAGVHKTDKHKRR